MDMVVYDVPYQSLISRCNHSRRVLVRVSTSDAGEATLIQMLFRDFHNHTYQHIGGLRG